MHTPNKTFVRRLSLKFSAIFITSITSRQNSSKSANLSFLSPHFPSPVMSLSSETHTPTVHPVTIPFSHIQVFLHLFIFVFNFLIFVSYFVFIDIKFVDCFSFLVEYFVVIEWRIRMRIYQRWLNKVLDLTDLELSQFPV